MYQYCKCACTANLAKVNNISAQKGYYTKVINVHKHKAEKDAQVLIDAVFGGRVPFFQRKLEEGNEFLNNLHIEAGPPEDKFIRSDDVCHFWISEVTAMKPDKGLAIIRSCLSRLTARFIDTMDVFPILLIDSSTTSIESALDLFLRTDPRAPQFFRIHVNAWNTVQGLHRFFNYGSFEMYAGDSQHNPFIIPDNYPLSERAKLDPDRFVTCPNELREEAEGDPILFVQEKCGLSTSSSAKFFTDLKRLGQAFCLDKHYDDVMILDFFDPTDTLMNKVREDVAKLPVERKLYVRLDCGISHDLFGVAVGYADGIDNSVIDGIVTDRMKIKIPLAFALSRYSGQETSISKIEDFIIQLSDN